MKHHRLLAIAAAAIGVASFATASMAQDTIKIGLIGPFSGGSSIWGRSWTQAINVFLKERGDTIDGTKVVIINRDLPTIDPLKAQALAQELVVKQGVQYMIGLVYSPNALALGAFANKAHVPIVILNAATSAILDKSKYFLRMSFTVPQVSTPEALYARQQGYTKMVTMVSDYAPGWDGEKYFSKAFEANGGKIVGHIRVPFATTDFLPYLQRAKTMGAQAIYTFLPGGGPTFGFMTAYNNSGLRASGLGYLGGGETDEDELQKYDENIVGIKTSTYYSGAHKSAENAKFQKLMAASYPGVIVNANHVDAYDGMNVIYHMIKATHGEKNGDKAIASAMGLKWESPRGTVQIDPKTRDLIQNVYIREVKKNAKGERYNDELVEFPAQPDYGRAGHPTPMLANTKSIKLSQ